ncbi:DNA polymerase I [Fervidicoccus fontis Kam940]|uniref:DNA polymerase n=2 Tax=Fervidicoccus fontis TaxID=683846 RepID=I0A1K6_FERFK|nr:DNA polymerase I [Fervidicoccus fontis Kam940]
MAMATLKRDRKENGPTLFDFINSSNKKEKTANNFAEDLTYNQDKELKDHEDEVQKLAYISKDNSIEYISSLLLNGNAKGEEENEKKIEELGKSSIVVNENKKIVWFVKVDNATINDGYLLSYYYDNHRNKAVLCFYEEKSGRILYWYDKTDHKPYFLAKESPEEIDKILNGSLKQKVISKDIVLKINPLTMKNEHYTKITVTDPLAVKEMRDKFRDSWESNIKYHHNFIFDRQLIPGAKYNVLGKNLALAFEGNSIPKEIEQSFSNEDEETLKFVRDVYPLFEQSPPQPKMAAIDIEVFSPYQNRVPDVSQALYPIVAISISTTDGKKIVLTSAYPLSSKDPIKSETKDIEVHVFDDEYSLIQEFFSILKDYPVVYTFNGDNFDLPYIRNRAIILGMREEEIPIEEFQDFYTFKNAIHIDLYHVFNNKALKTYAFGGEYRENTLNSIAEAIIGIGKVKVDENPGTLGISKLVEYNYRDSFITLELVRWKNFLTWKLLVLLSRLTKTSIEELSRTQISAWIKNMFYWEHRKRNYIIPKQEDILAHKKEIKSKAVIKGKKYAGAIVLNPPVGVFFNVVVLDFASLYPSIIKVWNLSYETVNPHYPCNKERTIPDVGHKVCFDRRGMTPIMIGAMRDLRVKVYKKKSKDKSISEERKEWYNAVQSALKVLLNASYGVFGSDNFALYAPPVAESVTAVGRYTITNTVEKAKSLGLRILYGDTDSMFIWSPSKEALQEIIASVEKEFGLDLEVDKEFRYVAFSGLKKNYLGVTSLGEVIIKGLLGKKRNQPEFLKQAFSDVIKRLSEINKPNDFLETQDKIKENVKKIYLKLKNMEYNLDELAFNVMLNKDVLEYKKNTPQHVKAALQLKPFNKALARGDIISYVKVKGKDGVKTVELAKLSDIDIEKYLDIARTTFEQILKTINISWEEIEGVARLESFFKN